MSHLCFYCAADVSDGDYVLVSRGVLGAVRCCGRCLERADIGEPMVRHLDYMTEEEPDA